MSGMTGWSGEEDGEPKPKAVAVVYKPRQSHQRSAMMHSEPRAGSDPIEMSVEMSVVPRSY